MRLKSLVTAIALCLLVPLFVLARPSLAATVTPTPLPTESTALTDIAVFTGTGNIKLDVSDFRNPSLVRVWAYAHGGMLSLSSRNIGWIVNEPPYYGESLLNYYVGNGSPEIDITTDSEWRVEISPLSYARTIQSPGSLSGDGDAVVVLSGNPVSAINVKTDGKATIAIDGYASQQISLLTSAAAVNAVLDAGEQLEVLTVRSKGEWTISTGETKAANVLTPTLTITSTRTKAPAIVITATPAPTVAPTQVKVTAVPTVAPTATSESVAKLYEIVKIDIRLTETNAVYEKNAWTLTLKNNSDKRLFLDATIQFVDKDEFIIDEDYARGLMLEPRETRTFSGAKLVNTAGSINIDAIQAQTELVNSVDVP